MISSMEESPLAGLAVKAGRTGRERIGTPFSGSMAMIIYMLYGLQNILHPLPPMRLGGIRVVDGSRSLAKLR